MAESVIAVYEEPQTREATEGPASPPASVGRTSASWCRPSVGEARPRVGERSGRRGGRRRRDPRRGLGLAGSQMWQITGVGLLLRGFWPPWGRGRRAGWARGGRPNDLGVIESDTMSTSRRSGAGDPAAVRAEGQRIAEAQGILAGHGPMDFQQRAQCARRADARHGGGADEFERSTDLPARFLERHPGQVAD